MNINEYLINTIDSISLSADSNELMRISAEISTKLCELNNYYGNRDLLQSKIYTLLYNYINNGLDKNTLIDSINTEFKSFINNVNRSNYYNSYSNNNTTNKSNTNSTKSKKNEENKQNNGTSKKNEENKQNDGTSKKNEESKNNETTITQPVTENKDSSLNSTSEPVTENSSNTLVTTNGANNQSEVVTDGNVVDVVIEEVNGAAAKYSEVESTIGSVNGSFNIPISEVQSDISALNSIVNQSKSMVTGSLGTINGALSDVVNEVVQNDESILEPAFLDESAPGVKVEQEVLTKRSFSEIFNLTSRISGKSRLVRANLQFFRDMGYDVNKSTVTIGDYKYNANTGELTHNGKNITVSYYIPESCIGDPDKISKLNTFTCLAAHGENHVSEGTGYASLSSLSSNTIIVVPGKTVDDVEYNDRSYSGLLKQVTYTTEFANLFANQKQGCYNIIGGCSSGGGSAIKAASKNEIYDGAVSINYPVLLDGIAEGKGVDSRVDADGKKVLSGKFLMLVEAKNDANKAYTESGVRQLPNALYATNGNSLFKKFATKEYSSHADYHGLLNDLINSGILGNNEYTI